MLKILSDAPLHKSATCVVLAAIDSFENNRPVALKLMLHADQFEREKRAREGLDSVFVVRVRSAPG